MRTYTPQPTYSTHDIYLSACLRLNGFKLITFNKDNRGRGIFVFEDRPERAELVQKYFSGELTGNLKNFISTWKDLKGLLYEMGNEEGR
jgi:hypothetical protein